MRLVSLRDSVVGADDQHAGQLALGAGSRLQGDAGKAADLLQPFLQLVHQQQAALHGLDRLERVQPGEAGQAGGLLVDLGVVLHRAGAERVDARVDAVVQLRQAGEVADHIHLGQFGQRQVLARQALRAARPAAHPARGSARRCRPATDSSQSKGSVMAHLRKDIHQ